MKLQKKNRTIFQRPAIWLIAVCALILTLSILEKTHVIDLIKSPLNSSGPTAEEQERQDAVNANKKKDLIENDPKSDTTPTAPATSSANIELSARQEANGMVTVFTKLYGFSSGTCELTVVNGTKSTSQTAPAMYQPEFSSCAGFSIPISSIGKGTWLIKLHLNPQGESQDKTISFEVT